MKKSILNLGKALGKLEQQSIQGGGVTSKRCSSSEECAYCCQANYCISPPEILEIPICY